MTRKPKQKEETRWCIETPRGELRLWATGKYRDILKEEFCQHTKGNWDNLKKQGYKCVKIKIRRA